LYRWFKKPFAKDAHVIEADKLTKEHYNTFREKLYNLYVKLHKDFPQLPEGKKYETDISELVFTKINIKLEETYNKLKAKAEAAKAEDATPEETTNDTTATTQSPQQPSTATTQSPQQPSTATTQSPQQSPSTATTQSPQQPSTATTTQPPQSSEEDITTVALQNVEESKKARLKARADAINAKEKLMKIEDDAKEKMEALAKQKAELEEQARVSVLNSREAIAKATETGIKGSTNFTALLGKSPQITNAKGAIGDLGKDLGVKQLGLLKKIPTNLTQQFATV
jgi:hypothetical protein